MSLDGTPGICWSSGLKGVLGSGGELDGYGAKKTLELDDELQCGSCCYLKKEKRRTPTTGGKKGQYARRRFDGRALMCDKSVVE